MAGNNVSVKAHLGKENKQVNLNRTVNRNSKSCNKSSEMQKISECQNTGLPTKTAEPALGYTTHIRRSKIIFV